MGRVSPPPAVDTELRGITERASLHATVGDVPINGVVYRPATSPAATLEDVKARTHQRLVDLLDMSTEPKDLAAAVKAATDWVKANQESAPDDGWGSNLRRVASGG